MQPAMREEWSGWPPLPKRRAGEEEEAGRKEGLVCLFPERHRNCYMRNYLISHLQMLFTGFTPLSPFEPPLSSCNPAFCHAAAALSCPLSHPSTSSWFPPGCESSSTSLRSKFMCICSSSWIWTVFTPHTWIQEPSSAQQGKLWWVGWFVGFQLRGGYCRCGVACWMLCGTQLGTGGSGRRKLGLCINH